MFYNLHWKFCKLLLLLILLLHITYFTAGKDDHFLPEVEEGLVLLAHFAPLFKQ